MKLRFWWLMRVISTFTSSTSVSLKCLRLGYHSNILESGLILLGSISHPWLSSIEHWLLSKLLLPFVKFISQLIRLILPNEGCSCWLKESWGSWPFSRAINQIWGMSVIWNIFLLIMRLMEDLISLTWNSLLLIGFFDGFEWLLGIFFVAKELLKIVSVIWNHIWFKR